MSASDFSGRLLEPVIARPRRPLSSSASTASCSMRFSLRTMMSGAVRSSRRFRRLLRLMTRRYRSFRSEVAKRPPSSGTSGRRSGGSTGSTFRIIHSRLVAGLPEGLHQLETLGELLDLGFRVGLRNFLAQARDLLLEIDVGDAAAWIASAPIFAVELVAVLLERLVVLLVVEQLPALERGHAGVDDDEGLEIQHALDVAQRHVEQQADARRQRLQEPDVRHRARQLDVAHALAAHLGQRHLDAALLADHAAVLEALVLAAQALVVLDGPEDLGAEQAVALRLERTVIDRLRLLDLAERPRTDHLRRGEPDADRIELFAGCPGSSEDSVSLSRPFLRVLLAGFGVTQSRARYRWRASGFP